MMGLVEQWKMVEEEAEPGNPSQLGKRGRCPPKGPSSLAGSYHGLRTQAHAQGLQAAHSHSTDKLSLSPEPPPGLPTQGSGVPKGDAVLVVHEPTMPADGLVHLATCPPDPHSAGRGGIWRGAVAVMPTSPAVWPTTSPTPETEWHGERNQPWWGSQA